MCHKRCLHLGLGYSAAATAGVGKIEGGTNAYDHCFGIISMVKTIQFFERFAAKQVRPCSDESATVDLVPRGETLDAKEPAKLIVV